MLTKYSIENTQRDDQIRRKSSLKYFNPTFLKIFMEDKEATLNKNGVSFLIITRQLGGHLISGVNVIKNSTR